MTKKVRIDWEEVSKTLFFALVSFSVAVSMGQGQGTSNAPLTKEASAYTPTLTYDVATIKKCAPAYSFRVGILDLPHSGNFSAWHKSAKELIEEAYAVESPYLSGGPEWLDSDYFDVVAKSDPSTDQRLMTLSNDQATLEKQHMLQIFLEERFGLKVHWVTKEMSGYSLIVGKKGSKLKEVQTEGEGSAGGNGVRPSEGPPYQTHWGPSGYELISHRMPMKFLATWISGDVRAPVVDRTGLTGRYEFTLQYLPRGKEETDGAWASIFTAIQEELGLKLESTKTSIATLVVDSIEQPSAN